MSRPKAVLLTVVVGLGVLIVASAALRYIRGPQTLTLDRFSPERLEPWPEGVRLIDSWPGLEGPGGSDIAPEAESLYLLVGGDDADLRGGTGLDAIADHLRGKGWDVRIQESDGGWVRFWGHAGSPPIWFQLGHLDGYLEDDVHFGVERSNQDLRSSYGQESDLLVLQVTASE
jgi:hypothetical protein